MMRLLTCLPFFIFYISFANAAEPQLFGANISVNELCHVSISKDDKTSIVKPDFSELGHCRLITLAQTNVLNTKYIAGSYLFFVENNLGNIEHCHSEYTAIGVSKELIISTTDFIKNSGRCYQDKDLVSFEYFSNKLTVLEN